MPRPCSASSWPSAAKYASGSQCRSPSPQEPRRRRARRYPLQRAGSDSTKPWGGIPGPWGILEEILLGRKVRKIRGLPRFIGEKVYDSYANPFHDMEAPITLVKTEYQRRMAAQRILMVVDDDPAVARAIASSGTSLGLQPVVCSSALEFWDRFQAVRPSCIVMDVR